MSPLLVLAARHVRNALAIVLGFFILAWMPVLRADDSGVFVYHGWHVDLSRAEQKQPLDKSISAVCRQLDIVESVHLPSGILAFMRTVPIWADPSRRTGDPAYFRLETGVDVHVRDLDPERPMVLHELLHAFHVRRLGLGNRAVEGFFKQAQQKQAWPADAYFLTNEKEFFAVTASIYLYGSISRPPYSREELHGQLPEYYQWLADLFDAGNARTFTVGE